MTNYSLLVADLFQISYEGHFILSLSAESKTNISEPFNSNSTFFNINKMYKGSLWK